MKKTSILMLIGVAASLFSCTAQSPKANLKTDVDTLSYAMGVAHTQGLREYLLGQVGMDSTQMNTFIKGLNDGMKKTSKKDEAYMVGLQIGQQINKQMIPHINRDLFGNDSTQTISIDNFMAGFISAATKKGTLMTPDSAQQYAREHTEIIKEKALEKQFGENKALGERFLADNKDREGIQTTESGLQYKVLTEGNGEIPKATDRVKVNYKGTLIDGTEFDSSYKRNEPATFAANQVIAGWTEALTMMPVGSKWLLYIPQELAYGARNQGTIPPYSTLIFEVELVEIVK